MDKRTEQLFLMLGSDQPGEVFNAARMLVKHLKKQGGDLHALLGQINGADPAGKTVPYADYARAVAGRLQVEQERDAAREELRKLKLVLEMVKDEQAFEGWVNRRQAQQNTYQPQQAGDDWRAQAEWALAWGWEHRRISQKEYEFLDDIVHAGPHYQLSLKQAHWLGDIHVRLRRVQSAASG